MLDGDERFVCVLRRPSRPDRASSVPMERRTASPCAKLERWLRTVAETPHAEPPTFWRSRSRAGGPPSRRQRARIAAFAAPTAAARLLGAAAAGGRLRTLARDTPIAPHVWRFVVLHAAQYGLWLVAWIILLQLALHSAFGSSDLRAWALTLGTLAIARAWQAHAARMAALAGGTVIKRRVLDAALRLRTDRIRHAGVGHFLGRALESDAIETAGPRRRLSGDERADWRSGRRGRAWHTGRADGRTPRCWLPGSVRS